RAPCSPPFPYTTLFRSAVPASLAARLITVDGVRAFVLATAQETGGRPVVFTQKDVRQLQFAKGSIASGIKVLMKVMGVGPADLSSEEHTSELQSRSDLV